MTENLKHYNKFKIQYTINFNPYKIVTCQFLASPKKQLFALIAVMYICLIAVIIIWHKKYNSDKSFRANSIFWTRALNIPFPHSYVYPLPLIEEDAHSMEHSTSFGDTTPQVLSEISESIPHESTDKCSVSNSLL